MLRTRQLPAVPARGGGGAAAVAAGSPAAAVVDNEHARYVMGAIFVTQLPFIVPHNPDSARHPPGTNGLMHTDSSVVSALFNANGPPKDLPLARPPTAGPPIRWRKGELIGSGANGRVWAHIGMNETAGGGYSQHFSGGRSSRRRALRATAGAFTSG